ncbi:helix-turn-helix domain-containing protein [Aliarcobacter skirrowii]|uniref:helix-turn-helix domain-containing protein n=1 Tax=Aliarcobacter skirrowii TaxID=28200 RepID=UPI000D61C779|nr:helix-turn-helix domain-containing protein [Aliarcobacter skirrowii]PWE20294.1 hypothetical protein DGF29_06550 [Aliarcobacter skirrowii]PWE25037.1 hypothetical protein DGE88_07620 [Aliarcobacter skirrowii]RJO55627.1 hypothetical protein DIR39_06555 [Aliarcobacter skirrowii]RJO57582.1 hypothetical protein DIR38_06555 [Aliarcobacter skirrowii]
MENVEDILERLFSYYKVASVAELSKQINTSQKTISNWKIRNSVSAVKKKCRELGIYNEIFGDLNLSSNKKTNIDLAKYFKALQSVAIATNKEDEFVEDIKNLMIKYIGENK